MLLGPPALRPRSPYSATDCPRALLATIQFGVCKFLPQVHNIPMAA